MRPRCSEPKAILFVLALLTAACNGRVSGVDGEQPELSRQALGTGVAMAPEAADVERPPARSGRPESAPVVPAGPALDPRPKAGWELEPQAASDKPHGPAGKHEPMSRHLAARYAAYEAELARLRIDGSTSSGRQAAADIKARLIPETEGSDVGGGK
jgi:hypothetical protein